MKKRLICLLFALLFALALTVPALADLIPDKQQYPNLVDEAGLLTDEEYDSLLSLLDEVSRKTGFTVAVVTVDSLGGKTAEAFADDWYDYNGYGSGEGDDGVLFLISMGEREWALTDYGRATRLMDRAYDSLCDSFMPSLRSGNYYEAFRRFARGCERALSEEAASEYVTEGIVRILPVCGIIGLVVGFIVVSALRAQVKNVHLQRAASDYARPGSLNIVNGYENFRNRVVSKTARADDSGGSGGTHRSSSGRSHGGRSGHF